MLKYKVMSFLKTYIVVGRYRFGKVKAYPECVHGKCRFKIVTTEPRKKDSTIGYTKNISDARAIGTSLSIRMENKYSVGLGHSWDIPLLSPSSKNK